MALFGRRPRPGRLPVDTLAKMEQFGRYSFDWQKYPMQESPEAEMYMIAQGDQDGFLAELAALVVPTGGWSAYGGMKLVMSILGADVVQPDYDAIVLAGLHFIRSHGVPKSRLSINEMNQWRRLQGEDTPWLLGRPVPPDRLTPLQPGEMRRVAQMFPGPRSNVIYVQQAAPDRYVALIDGEWSEEDPRRVQNEWYVAPSLHQLYERLGDAFQTPSYWVDSELEPYIPLPPPTI